MAKKFKKVNFTTDGYAKFIHNDVEHTLTITSLATNPLVVPLGGSSPGNVEIQYFEHEQSASWSFSDYVKEVLYANHPVSHVFIGRVNIQHSTDLPFSSLQFSFNQWWACKITRRHLIDKRAIVEFTRPNVDAGGASDIYETPKIIIGWIPDSGTIEFDENSYIYGGNQFSPLISISWDSNQAILKGNTIGVYNVTSQNQSYIAEGSYDETANQTTYTFNDSFSELNIYLNTGDDPEPARYLLFKEYRPSGGGGGQPTVITGDSNVVVNQDGYSAAISLASSINTLINGYGTLPMNFDSTNDIYEFARGTSFGVDFMGCYLFNSREPTMDYSLVNKKYVDDAISSMVPSGDAISSLEYYDSSKWLELTLTNGLQYATQIPNTMNVYSPDGSVIVSQSSHDVALSIVSPVTSSLAIASSIHGSFDSSTSMVTLSVSDAGGNSYSSQFMIPSGGSGAGSSIYIHHIFGYGDGYEFINFEIFDANSSAYYDAASVAAAINALGLNQNQLPICQYVNSDSPDNMNQIGYIQASGSTVYAVSGNGNTTFIFSADRVQALNAGGGGGGDTSNLAVANSLQGSYSNNFLTISITSASGQTTSRTIELPSISAGYQHSFSLNYVSSNGTITASRFVYSDDASSYFNDYSSFYNYLSSLPGGLDVTGDSTIVGSQAQHSIIASYSSWSLQFTFNNSNTSKYTLMTQVPVGVYQGTTIYNNEPSSVSSVSINITSDNVIATWIEDGTPMPETFSKYLFNDDFNDSVTSNSYEGDVIHVAPGSTPSSLDWSIVNSDGDTVHFVQSSSVGNGTYVDTVSDSPLIGIDYDSLLNLPCSLSSNQMTNFLKQTRSKADSAKSLATAAQVTAAAASAGVAELELVMYTPLPIPIIAPSGGVIPQLAALDASVVALQGQIGGINAQLATKIGTVIDAVGEWHGVYHDTLIPGTLALGLKTPTNGGPEYMIQNSVVGNALNIQRDDGNKVTEVFLSTNGNQFGQANNSLFLKEHFQRPDVDETQTFEVGDAFINHNAGSYVSISENQVGLRSETDINNYSNIEIAPASINLINVTNGNLKSVLIDSDSINAGTRLITNVSDPVNNQDAATKAYVDNVNAGIPDNIDKSGHNFLLWADNLGLKLDDTQIIIGDKNADNGYVMVQDGGHTMIEGQDITVITPTGTPMRYDGVGVDIAITDNNHIPNKLYVDNSITGMSIDENTLARDEGVLGVRRNFIIPGEDVQSFTAGDNSLIISDEGIVVQADVNTITENSNNISLTTPHASIILNNNNIQASCETALNLQSTNGSIIMQSETGVITNQHISDTSGEQFEDTSLVTKAYVDFISGIYNHQIMLQTTDGNVMVRLDVINKSDVALNDDAVFINWLQKMNAINITLGLLVTVTTNVTSATPNYLAGRLYIEGGVAKVRTTSGIYNVSISIDSVTERSGW